MTENILIWLLSGATVALENGICFGGYAAIYGIGWKKKTRWSRSCFLAVVILLSMLDVLDYKLSLVNTFQALFGAVWHGIAILLFTREKPLRIFGWTAMVDAAWLAFVVPLLTINGVLDGDGMYANLHPSTLWVVGRLIWIGVLAGLCIRKGRKLSEYINAYHGKEVLLYFVLAALEWITALYVINIAYFVVRGSSVILSFVFVFCIVLILLFLFMQSRYNLARLESQLYRSKGELLQADCRLLCEAQERSRKISHDHRYDMNYLYVCLEEGEAEKAKHYIEQKMTDDRLRGGVTVWTGVPCVDALLSSAMQRAKEKRILFAIQSQVSGLPMEEYEFFTVLGNLLDNAQEAAGKCEEGNRHIKLKLWERDEMFLLTLENSCALEPRQERGVFLTSKGGEGHGYGIANVREIVGRKGGNSDFRYENGRFLVRITFGM